MISTEPTIGRRLDEELLEQDELVQETLKMASSSITLTDTADTATTPPSSSSWTMLDIQAVVTAALLVTGNTVGAGALVLPDLAAKPGLAVSTAVFVGAYGVNLLSGLFLAEVAIRQHDEQQQRQMKGESTQQPPSSFRDLASLSLESPTAANGIAAVSLFVNTCALPFSLGRAGVIVSDIITANNIMGDGGIMDSMSLLGDGVVESPIELHVVASIMVAGLLAVMGATQSRVRISQISSGVVAALFGSVAGLILPGLANVQDPLD